MNTWGYSILIFALALLAVAMLYSKFAYRSREKSLHHSPMDVLFSPASISVAAVEPVVSPVPEGLKGEDMGISLSPSIPTIPTIRLEAIGESENSSQGEKSEQSGASHRESDYFDELQEAAAGLAALMRSSPVDRVEPVIFAPEENEVPVEAAISLPPETETETEAETDREEEVSSGFGVSEVADTPETEVSAGETVIEVPSRRTLLGDEVVGRMDQIDLELDALEMLVESIESSLVALESRNAFSGKVDSNEGEDLISVAA